MRTRTPFAVLLAAVLAAGAPPAAEAAEERPVLTTAAAIAMAQACLARGSTRLVARCSEAA